MKFAGRRAAADPTSPLSLDKDLSLAEAFLWITRGRCAADKSARGGLGSDLDFGLAGAVLIDLSLAGKVDSDAENLFVLDASPAQSPALIVAQRALRSCGAGERLDNALNLLVERSGDLRATSEASLAEKGLLVRSSKALVWDFRRVRTGWGGAGRAEAFRASLRRLVESDELPGPAEAALLSLLCACDLAGPVLGGARPGPWLRKVGPRLQTIRRLDLVGRAVAAAIVAMRARLRTYLADADAEVAGEAPKYQREKATWEWRAFWPVGERVSLPEEWTHADALAACAEEALEDRYLFVHGKRDNIKIRKNGLKIKPVIEAFDAFTAFGGSVKFGFPEKTRALAGLFPRLYETRCTVAGVAELLDVLSAAGYRPSLITVEKKRRVLPVAFGVQMEFARIRVRGREFHSISLESAYLAALRALARDIPVGESGLVMGYAEYLDHVARLPEGPSRA